MKEAWVVIFSTYPNLLSLQFHIKETMVVG